MEAGLLRFCNWSTLGVCAALKLPQISAVLAAHSARGLSLPSLLLELAGFLVFLRYQCYYGYPPLTYLEYPILIAQDVALLLCIFHFNGNVKQAAPYVAALACSWFVLTLQKWIIDLAMNLCTFISAASKFAQLQCLWKTRDSGAVSALTWSLSAYSCASKVNNFNIALDVNVTCIFSIYPSSLLLGAVFSSPWSHVVLIRARIVTTLMTTKDFTILTRFVIMLALNTWVTVTVLRYQKTVKKAE
ncbi:solute carrier family 66 member 3 isoform X1 [Nycticebus coucang]|uniref:solute carrier family 66 member 3 isoform X1 n=1 Tax=Nycticebus coucang TaxID=9470 RepID=UPI00234D0AB1|nr:solute carrier family 66 member 3 isoform X1 [Nycticebus coucang]